MKIFFVGRYNNSDILTGSEKVAKKLFYSLQYLNDNILFVTYFFKSYNGSSLYNRLFGFSDVSENKSVKRMGIVRILFFVIKEKPDLIHFITLERFYLPLLILKPFLNFRMIYTVHGLLKIEKRNAINSKNIFGNFKDSLAENLLFRLSDKIIFLSNPSFMKAKQQYRIGDRNFAFIANGVEKNQNKRKKEFDLERTLNICFYAGPANGFNRGIKKLVEILEELNGIQFVLNIIGNDNSITSEKIKIEYFELMNKEKLNQYLQSQFICIDSLTHTTFPLFILEAMNRGLIIITSTDSGISDIIQNEINGFVYYAEFPQDIRKIISDIHNKKYDLESISENAVSTTENLGWDTIAEKYLNLYKDVLTNN